MSHLSTEELTECESALQRLHAAALAEIRERLHQDGAGLALPNHYADTGDQAGSDLLGDTDIGQLAIDLTRLDAIERALALLHAGAYGRCSDCGQDIPLPRLRAQPAAHTCLACQAARETGRLAARA